MTFAIGERYKSILADGIREHNLDVLWLPDNALLDTRLAGHADLNICAANSAVVISHGQNEHIVNLLTRSGICIKRPKAEESLNYPSDCSLCILDTGKYLFYSPKTADPGAVELFTDRTFVELSQGYTRCAAAVINEESIITSDAGVSKAAKNAGLNVLDITPGFIELPGFNYGFIGGAGFMLDKKTIAFTGQLNEHPDKERIYAFLSENGVSPVFLRDGFLIDIGGAVALP